MNQKSFCPQCTTQWDRPWYDVCPSCGHRFIGHPWWHSPTLIIVLICLPAAFLMLVGFLARGSGSARDWDLEGVALGTTLLGGPLTSIIAGTIMALRTGKKRGAVIGWSVFWAIIFIIVSLTLCFFSCLYSFDQ